MVSNNDDMALGAIDALERAGIRDVNVVGIDGTIPGTEALEAGKLLGTVSANKEVYAGAIMELAASCALGQELPDSYRLTAVGKGLLLDSLLVSADGRSVLLGFAGNHDIQRKLIKNQRISYGK